MQEPSGGPSYLNSVAYTAHGAIDNMQLGNLLVEQTCYNDLLQPTDRRLGNATSSNCAIQTSTDLLHLGFDYGASTTNNGNMLQQTIWAPDNGSGQAWQVTQDYTYDQVNRLATAAEKLSGETQWTRSYSYDHFGNRWISGATGHTLHMATPTSQSAIQASTNRLTGAGIVYNNAGNLTTHPHITPAGSMAYDANNKMTAFAKTGVSVATRYDAAGRRVRKVYNGQTTVWVYDALEKLAAEYTTEAQATDAAYYPTTDHLGSTRLLSDGSGGIAARVDYTPYGERIDSNLSSRGSVTDAGQASYSEQPNIRQRFTSQERDDETDLDYFDERNYQPCLARFSSVDPSNAGARRRLPQRWNAYSYVANRPMTRTDPTGKFIYVPTCDPFAEREPECDEEDGPIEWDNPGPCPNCGGTGGGDEDDGGAGDPEPEPPAPQDEDLLDEALAKAAKALDNPDCAEIFGDRGRQLDPVEVLRSIMDATAENYGQYGRIVFRQIGPNKEGSYAVAVTSPRRYIPRVGSLIKGRLAFNSVTININTNLNSYAWNNGDLRENANTLLHELGHALHFLGVRTGDDTGFRHNDGSEANQLHNDSVINDKCLKGLF